MTPAMIAAMFGVMFVLALVPGVSVLTVSARTAAYGFVHGASTTAGIIAGDIFFILIAIFGLSFLADALGDMFIVVKLVGGMYLVWLGLSIWKKQPAIDAGSNTASASLLSSFMAGLLITLADQKAILFYLGLLPAFIELSSISAVETGIIIITAGIAIGCAKLGYAGLANKARGLTEGPRAVKGLNTAAALALTGTGAFLLVNIFFLQQ